MLDLIEKITTAYAMDRSRMSESAVSTFDLPRSYESITPEWLTAITCTKRRGAAVVGYQLDIPDNGSSNRRKIHLEYNEPGRESGLPQALFCKATHDLTSRILLGVSGTARSEVIFYNNIRPLLNIEAPKSLFARFDPESFNSIIVLPDLSGRVTEFCSHKTKMTRERAEGQIALLAEMHGRCYHSPQLNSQLMSLPTWPEFFGKMVALGIKEGSHKGFLAAKGIIPPRIYRQLTEIWPAAVTSVERHARLPQTLVHGDVHLKNWYITRSGEMGLSDWQTASRGHWSRDVAHTISTALTVEERRAWEKELLRFYVDRMHAAGGPVVSFDEAWTHYRQQLMSVLIWWTVTLTGEPDFPDMQPGNTTMEFVRRIATAVDDVESLQSF
jgi:hypothetical protein